MLSFSKSELIERLAETLDIELLRGKKALELGGGVKVLEQADTQGLSALGQVGDLSAQMDSAQEHLQQLEGLPFLGDLFESLMEGAKGAYAGHQVLLCKTSHSKNQDGVLVAVMYSQPLPCQFFLYPERFSSRLGKLLFRQQDVQLGEPELDPLIMVKTPTPEQARQFLTRRDRVAALLRLYQDGQEFLTNQLGLRIVLGMRAQVDEVMSLLERMLAVADAFTKAD